MGPHFDMGGWRMGWWSRTPFDRCRLHSGGGVNGRGRELSTGVVSTDEDWYFLLPPSSLPPPSLVFVFVGLVCACVCVCAFYCALVLVLVLDPHPVALERIGIGFDV